MLFTSGLLATYTLFIARSTREHMCWLKPGPLVMYPLFITGPLTTYRDIHRSIYSRSAHHIWISIGLFIAGPLTTYGYPSVYLLYYVVYTQFVAGLLGHYTLFIAGTYLATYTLFIAGLHGHYTVFLSRYLLGHMYTIYSRSTRPRYAIYSRYLLGHICTIYSRSTRPLYAIYSRSTRHV